MLLLDFKTDEKFLQSHKMSFSIPANSIKTTFLEEDRQLEFDNNFFYITKKKVRRTNTQTYYDIEASALWYRLGERGYSGEFAISAVTPEYGLRLILEAAQEDNLDWTSGLVSASTSLYSINVTDASYLDIIRQWAKICGCELTFDTVARTVNMVEHLGGNYGLSFRYERNLLEIEREVIPPAITRLYPYGRNDLTIAGQNAGVEYLEDYSYYTAQGLTLLEAEELYRKDYRVKDDSFVDDVSLYQWAVGQMANLAQPFVTYRIKVADLTTITGYDESNIRLGDYAVVEDEPLGISVLARVVRIVRYPYEPGRNEVELSTAPVSLPDPNLQNGRSDAKSWELFVARNFDTPKTIGIGRTVLHRMPLIANQEAEWIIEYSFKGTCNVSGTLQLTFTDDLTFEPFLPTINLPVTAGQEYSHTISVSSENVPIGNYRFVVRGEMTGASGQFAIGAGDMNLWVFARGVTRGSNPAYVNTQRFNYTGALQQFRVPDDVYELFIECHGPGNATSWPSQGGYVSGYLQVIPGDYLDVRVGGNNNGYPNNGGLGNGPFTGQQSGGSSTDVRAEGAAFIDAHIVAAGAGGQGEGGSGHTNNKAGYGGFERGGDAERPGGGGKGATQSAGGTGGGGFPGSFNQGGMGGWGGSFFEFGGGGGGGGWYGGSGGSDGGGGGGGSGWVGVEIYDYEWTDNENGGQGYVDISWANPEV